MDLELQVTCPVQGASEDSDLGSAHADKPVQPSNTFQLSQTQAVLQTSQSALKDREIKTTHLDKLEGITDLASLDLESATNLDGLESTNNLERLESITNLETFSLEDSVNSTDSANIAELIMNSDSVKSTELTNSHDSVKSSDSVKSTELTMSSDSLKSPDLVKHPNIDEAEKTIQLESLISVGSQDAKLVEPETEVFEPKAFLKTVPNRPGSYRMYDASGTVIYVGKAKDLKKRLSSYFLKHGQSTKTKALVANIARIEFTITFSESEALILENELIKQYQPRYNILLRDDKSYPYILLTSKHEHPGIYYHRGTKRRIGEYFGPFPDSNAVKESLRLLQRLFPVRQCEDSVYAHRSRPCLMAQMGRCLAPCVPMSPEKAQHYQEQVSLIRMFLKGQNQKLLQTMAQKMEEHAEKLEFEEAALLRDQMTALRRVQESNSIISDVDYPLDVIGHALQDGMCCIHILFIRQGRILGSRSFYPKLAVNTDSAHVLFSFLTQFYLNENHSAMLPDEILLDCNLKTLVQQSSLDQSLESGEIVDAESSEDSELGTDTASKLVSNLSSDSSIQSVNQSSESLSIESSSMLDASLTSNSSSIDSSSNATAVVSKSLAVDLVNDSLDKSDTADTSTADTSNISTDTSNISTDTSNISTDTSKTSVVNDEANDNVSEDANNDAKEDVNDAANDHTNDDTPAVLDDIEELSDTVDLDVLADALEHKFGRKIRFAWIARGAKSRYVKLAKANAQVALQSKLSSQSTAHQRIEELEKVLGISDVERMECYDISHTMGENTVASCVVFNREGPDSSRYRRYNISGIALGDDFAAMHQVLSRRFRDPDNGEMPQLIFIDGGMGQLEQAEEVLTQSFAHAKRPMPMMVAVAKGEKRKPGLETLIIGFSHEKIHLPLTSAALQLVLHIRDESHRFAITGHRAKRSKARTTSKLESIAGVGPKRRQALLQHLGGMQEVLSASVDELQKVPGISLEMANKIYDELHSL